MLFARTAAYAIVAMAIALGGCAANERNKTAGEYVDDTVVNVKVKTALVNQEGVDAADINVETYRGTVQLSGFVDSEDERRMALEAARRVEGVKSVRDGLTIK